jgi:hypothetical protein
MLAHYIPPHVKPVLARTPRCGPSHTGLGTDRIIREIPDLLRALKMVPPQGGLGLTDGIECGHAGGHSFQAALIHTAPYAIGAFALCGVLSMLLPRTAMAEETLTGS